MTRRSIADVAPVTETQRTNKKTLGKIVKTLNLKEVVNKVLKQYKPDA